MAAITQKAPRKRHLPPDGIEICYLCFEESHRSPNCRFNACKDDPNFQRYALCNYAKLKPRQREFIDSAGQMPQLLMNHEPALNVERLKVNADHKNANSIRVHRLHSPKGAKGSTEGKSLSFQTVVGTTEN